MTLLRRRALPARGRGGDRDDLVLLLAVAGIGVLLANPIANQVVGVPATRCPAIVDDANDTLADLQGWLDRNGIDLQVQAEGQTARADCSATASRRARASSSRFTRDALLRLAEASIALILIFVLSIYMLLYGERIGAGGARGRPAGRRHAGGRLPDAASRARCSATSAASCCSR